MPKTKKPERWVKIAAYGPYGLWTKSHAGETIYQVNTQEPTIGSGGYFDVFTAIRQKGLLK